MCRRPSRDSTWAYVRLATEPVAGKASIILRCEAGFVAATAAQAECFATCNATLVIEEDDSSTGSGWFSWWLIMMEV